MNNETKTDMISNIDDHKECLGIMIKKLTENYLLNEKMSVAGAHVIDYNTMTQHKLFLECKNDSTTIEVTINIPRS